MYRVRKFAAHMQADSVTCEVHSTEHNLPANSVAVSNIITKAPRVGASFSTSRSEPGIMRRGSGGGEFWGDLGCISGASWGDLEGMLGGFWVGLELIMGTSLCLQT